MRLWPFVGALLSLVTGMPTDPVDVAPPGHVELPAAERGRSIEGDGFVVWDEDARAAEDWAVELRGPVYPPRAQ
jgi:hypothetical protein